MRVGLVQTISALFGRPLSLEDARLNWDVGVCVVAGFAALVGSALLWEPVFSHVVLMKLVACGALVLVAVVVAFRRILVFFGLVFFVAMRWLIAAIELRKLPAMVAALLLGVVAVSVYLFCLKGK
jgi:hypothetical protein